METIDGKIKYSFKEKYFLIEPEGRIRRYQLLARILAPGFILILLFFIIGLLFSQYMVFWAWSYPQLFGALLVLLGAAFAYISYRITYVLYTKRCHDFGNDGRLVQKIVLGVLIVNILWSLVSILDIYRIVIVPLEMTHGIQEFMNGISGIAGLILLFTPGMTGDNPYGKDPINTKVVFLG